VRISSLSWWVGSVIVRVCLYRFLCVPRQAWVLLKRSHCSIKWWRVRRRHSGFLALQRRCRSTLSRVLCVARMRPIPSNVL
jgi:hypothetical protein